MTTDQKLQGVTHVMLLLLLLSYLYIYGIYLFHTYRLSHKRAASCSQKPHAQTTYHDVFPVVAVSKVTEERGQ